MPKIKPMYRLQTRRAAVDRNSRRIGINPCDAAPSANPSVQASGVGSSRDGLR